jgi:hypothetical protein
MSEKIIEIGADQSEICSLERKISVFRSHSWKNVLWPCSKHGFTGERYQLRHSKDLFQGCYEWKNNWNQC